MNQIETTLKVKLAAGARSAQLALSWTSPLDRFTLSGLKVVRHGKVVATAARKRKLEVDVRTGSTFAVVKVSHLRKGRLRFKVKAAAIGSGQPAVTLTTQVSQSHRR